MTLAAAAPADPVGVSRLAASFVGTDTDTIATMAAALTGASDAAPDPEPVLDTPYLTAEATRLAEIASGHATTPFSYPDLLHWIPPRTQLDAVGIAGSLPAMAGLGWLELAEGTKRGESRGTIWEWMHTDFGASLLVKRRPKLPQLPDVQWPIRREINIDPSLGHAGRKVLEDQLPLDDDVPMSLQRAETRSQRSDTYPGNTRDPAATRDPVNIDQMLHWLARRGFPNEEIGYATRRISELGTLEQLIAFTTALRTAIRRSPR
jgi:hypothetical protein